MAKPQALRHIYQLKISLQGAKPPIWRRVLVDSAIKLNILHDVIQISMGWQNCHLHVFDNGGQLLGEPDPDMFMDVANERQYRLDQILVVEKKSMNYEYDFGDSWRHIITLEKILPFEPSLALPVCIKAVGACPPEDCGGLWGYYELLEILEDPDHPEREQMLEWLGGCDVFDYDIAVVNQMLMEYCR